MDLDSLASKIAARVAPDALLDIEDVAALLHVSPRQFSEAYASAPGFPQALRLKTATGRSRPRWMRSDVMKWVTSHKTFGGRPRSG